MFKGTPVLDVHGHVSAPAAARNWIFGAHYFDYGTPAGSAQRTVGDMEVVANKVELGVACLREEHFLRIGDDHLAGADV